VNLEESKELSELTDESREEPFKERPPQVNSHLPMHAGEVYNTYTLVKARESFN